MRLYPHVPLRSWLAALFFLLNILSADVLFAASMENIQHALMKALEGNSDGTGATGEALPTRWISPNLLVEAYQATEFTPLWVDASGPTRRAGIIHSYLKNASTEGLNPDDYGVKAIGELMDASGASDLAKLEILLTTALHAYVSDVSEGRVDPCNRDPDLFTCARDRFIPPADLVNQLLTSKDLESFLKSQPPNIPQYQVLKLALYRYRTIEAAGGWRVIPTGPLLRPGAVDPRIPIIRHRLQISGDLAIPSPVTDSATYDDALVAAVNRFQKRHGLTQDGIIGNATRNAMNIPVADRIRQIIINMERLRWVSRDIFPQFVLVNIANFTLYVFEDTHPVLQMPVVVGTNYRKTPVFSDHIRHIDFNPYWNIPPSLAILDILPKIKKEDSYLEEMKIRMFDGWTADAVEIDATEINWHETTPTQMGTYKFRQDPGPQNALGKVKFMFPNRFAVYLHDTPSKELFDQTERSFSAGCIRVSDPVTLASYLLGGKENGWSEKAVKRVISRGERRVERLTTPIPVHLIYLTAIGGSDEEIFFYGDIYGRDEILEQALFREGQVP